VTIVNAQPPRISIVMANYNYGRFLAQAVESVLAQTHRDWELIIVDDGSSDDSHTVIGRYLDDPRIRFHPVDHLGQPGAKNAGLSLCRGEFVAFLDADDAWLPVKLELQLQEFEQKPFVGVVCTGRTLMDENGVELPYVQPPMPSGFVLAELFRDNFLCFSSVMAHRTVFEHVGGFDPSLNLAIDYDLWLRVAAHYEIACLPQPLVRYRAGHANLSRRLGERLKTALLIMRRFERRPAAQHLSPATRRAAYAETMCSMAYALRPFSRAQAAGWFCRALGQKPWHRPAWRGLFSLAIPSALRRLLRRLTCRKADWDAAYAAPQNDPRNA
jgi:glycosyltransferase involved in cell wall biosynthesis